MSWSKRLVAVFVVTFLAIQVTVPAVALFTTRPSRFAWQMYANFPQVPRAFVLNDDGSETAIQLGAHFVVQRVEIDYAGVLVRNLCERGVVAVRLERPDRDSETIQCP